MKSKRKIVTLIILLIVFVNFIISFNWSYNNMVKAVDNSIVKKVNPIGRVIGLKLYTNGVLVVGMSEVEDENGNKCKPYQNTGIQEGDMIKTANGEEVKNTTDLINIINSCKGQEIPIKYERDSGDIYTTIKPVKSNDGNYMMGLWVRDAAAGLGTLTYYDEENASFAALGHGIDDVDTGKLLEISNGEVVTSKIISIVKGEKGKPGEIRGTIDEGEKIGEIIENTEIGIYGKVTNTEFIDSIKLEEVPVASRNQIKIGKAKIFCQLNNEGIDEYEIEIKKIYKTNNKDNKSMLIKITDQKLINITGGIIPGMSGTPIIQDGKFIGAITNVLLNDPLQGYAIFADMMIK